MKNKVISLGVILSVVAVFASTGQAFARDRHDDNDRGGYSHHDRDFGDRDHNRFSFGLRLSFLPRNYVYLYSGGDDYYYVDGIYYTRRFGDFVAVRAPIGVRVRTIPSYYQQVILNGVTYYTYDGVYYVYTTQGYQVVPQPIINVVNVAPTLVAPTVQTVPVAPMEPQGNASLATSQDDNTFTVNIPNSKGGFNAVVIKRSGTGFVGPQGEFYQTFPKVEQLKVMYGQ
ncbi:MAG: hypothetical protein HQL25_01410 [Candidatus Omnitrophica bacterium]|nr:hypothetical protein [Candidatus Omnitrophota bacterium]